MKQKAPVQNSVEQILKAAGQATRDATLLQSAHVHVVLASLREHLELLSLETLARWLPSERHTVVATVLCFTEPHKAARILQRLPEECAVQMIAELAKPRQMNPELLETLLEELQELFQKSTSPLLSRGGEEKAATLLRGLSVEHRDRILTELAIHNSALQQRLQKQILTLEQVSSLLTRDLALVCSLFTNLDLALVLRPEKPSVRGRFLECVSSIRRTEIEELLDVNKPQFKTKVEQAQQRVLEKVDDLHKEGRIVFPWEQQVV